MRCHKLPVLDIMVIWVKTVDAIHERSDMASEEYEGITERFACSKIAHFNEQVTSDPHIVHQYEQIWGDDLSDYSYSFERVGIMARPGKFLYFAYGSNLLKERLKMLNPSAEFVTAAKLKDYELEFRTYGKDPMECSWKGAPASIYQKRGSCVWGCVWELRNEHKETLDWQEGVHANVYNPLEVDVFSQQGQTLHCRTYMLSRSSDEFDARPSPQYLDIIIRGAQQNGLPADYIAKLEAIEHNNYQGTVDIYHQILQILGS